MSIRELSDIQITRPDTGMRLRNARSARVKQVLAAVLVPKAMYFNTSPLRHGASEAQVRVMLEAVFSREFFDSEPEHELSKMWHLEILVRTGAQWRQAWVRELPCQKARDSDWPRSHVANISEKELSGSFDFFSLLCALAVYTRFSSLFITLCSLL